MMKEKIAQFATKCALNLRKNTPEILVIGGTIGLIAAGVIACKETTKLDTVLKEAEQRIDTLAEKSAKVEQYQEAGVLEKDEYTEDDDKKAVAKAYVENALSVAKLYAPAIILAVASTASILGGFGILKKRHAAIALAFGQMSAAYTEFKSRVKDSVGEEKFNEILDGVSKELKEVVDENGNQIVAEVDTVNPVKDPYTFEWNEYTTKETGAYTKGDPAGNLAFLKAVETAMNNKLRSLNGYVFLNEVLEEIGLPKTKAGQEVGWVMQPNDEHTGDNYIDFGITPVDDVNKETMKFTRNFVLHFNCDGYILDTFEHAFEGEK